MRDSGKRIDAAALTVCEVDREGAHVRLSMTDQSGENACLVLPLECVTQLLMTLPEVVQKAMRRSYRDPSLRIVFPLTSFAVELGEPDDAGQHQYILRLHTAGGFGVSFTSSSDGLAELAQSISSGVQEAAPLRLS